MPSFVWKGRNTSGDYQEGVLLADSKDAATAVLRQQQIRGNNAAREGKRDPIPSPLATKESARRRLALFTRQFSVMLDAGLPLVQCLEILGEQTGESHFRRH